jgi:PilZ domain
MEERQRRAPRYFFFADAELTEEASAVSVISRVSELSRHGCYLDMMNPFPAETIVKLKIAAGAEFFETRARTVHSTPNIGAGVAFLENQPGADAVLERWLERAAKE